MARAYLDPSEESSPIVGCVAFDLSDEGVLNAVRNDYEDVRWTVRNEGIYAVHGAIGSLVQPRVKGAAGSGYQGHGFYARAQFVGYMLGLEDALKLS